MSAAHRSALLSVLVLSQAAGTVAAVAAVLTLDQGACSRADLAWGIVAGITGSLGLVLLYGGIARSIVAIVSPASAVVAALMPVLFGLALGERPPAPAVASALCFPAILLLTWEGDRSAQGGKAARAALGYGVLAGLGFGCFFIALSAPTPRRGPGPWWRPGPPPSRPSAPPCWSPAIRSGWPGGTWLRRWSPGPPT